MSSLSGSESLPIVWVSKHHKLPETCITCGMFTDHGVTVKYSHNEQRTVSTGEATSKIAFGCLLHLLGPIGWIVAWPETRAIAVARRRFRSAARSRSRNAVCAQVSTRWLPWMATWPPVRSPLPRIRVLQNGCTPSMSTKFPDTPVQGAMPQLAQACRASLPRRIGKAIGQLSDRRDRPHRPAKTSGRRSILPPETPIASQNQRRQQSFSPHNTNIHGLHAKTDCRPRPATIPG